MALCLLYNGFMRPVGKIYNVTELTLEIKDRIEGGFSSLAVEGEICNFRPSSTGHLYFTLKDSGAVLPAVMFRGSIRGLGFEPRDGNRVVARGRLSVYPQRGSYQLICETLEMAGEGDLLAMLEERKRRLAALGLFDKARKKPLPLFPGRVAVVTSPTGAAIRDILTVLARRSAGVHVVVLPAPVQGETAARVIARQIRYANLWRMADVIIVGRGGGSLEDLLPFSEEELVRAVAESEIPIISAVGHEIDWALSDYAADFRAPTPSAAAEAVCAVRGELLDRVLRCRREIAEALHFRMEKIRLLLDRFTPEGLERQFQGFVQPVFFRLDDAKESLINAAGNISSRNRTRLELATAVLESCSPLEILRRGYALVRYSDSGKLVRSAGGLAAGEDLSIQVHEGEIDATVKEARLVPRG
jgi:exodeoxyribonuclease VII large subunit